MAELILSEIAGLKLDNLKHEDKLSIKNLIGEKAISLLNQSKEKKELNNFQYLELDGGIKIVYKPYLKNLIITDIETPENYFGLEESKKIVDLYEEIKHSQKSKNSTENNYFGFKSLKYLLPAKYREEILGDLFELNYELEKEGHSRLWIRFILFFNVIFILFASFRIKIG